MKCAVYNCVNDNKKNCKALSFFKFPDDPGLLKQWLKFCHMKVPLKGAVVCMSHFKNEDIDGSLKYDLGYSTRRHLKHGVVPSIIEIFKDEKTLLREERAAKRNYKKIVDSLLREDEQGSPLNEQPIENFEEIILPKPIKEETNPLGDQPFDMSLLPAKFSVETKEIESQSQPITNDDNIEFNEIEDCEEYYLNNIQPQVIVNTLKKENDFLKKENKYLKNKLQRMECLHKKEMERMQRWLQRAQFEHTNIESKLAKIFTKGQIRKLKSGSRKQLWSEEDINRSLSLYTMSGRAYQSLLNNNYPFPSIRTLQNWTRKSYLDQINSDASKNITIAHENDEPIFKELDDDDDDSISGMIQHILEDDNDGNDMVDHLIEVVDDECEETMLINNEDDTEILNCNETESINIEILSDIELETINIE